MTPPPLRLILDTNVFGDLIEWDQADPTPIRDRLIAASNGNLVCVQGSLEVFAEATRVFRSRPGHFRKIAELLFQLVGDRWMLPLLERWQPELAQPGLLADRALYLNLGQRRRLSNLNNRDRAIDSIAEEIARQAAQYKIDTEATRSEILARLRQEGFQTQSQIRQAYIRWFNEVDTQQWCRDMLDDGVKLGQFPAPLNRWPDLQQAIPSLWHWMRFRLARIALEVGEQRRIAASDEYDARHYSAAAGYSDIFVTNDRLLRETCAMIGETHFRVANLLELDKILGGLDRRSG